MLAQRLQPSCGARPSCGDVSLLEAPVDRRDPPFPIHSPIKVEAHLARPNRQTLLDRTTLFFIVLAAVLMAVVASVRSTEVLIATVGDAMALFVTIAPLVVMGLFLGGLVKAMADPQRIAPWLGAGSGLRGLVLASALGAITPGGPFAAFPIVTALFAAGADVGAVVAFVTGWSLLALHRVVVWELPLIGIEFVGLRLLVSLPLALVAGLIARRLVTRIPAFRDVVPPMLSRVEGAGPPADGGSSGSPEAAAPAVAVRSVATRSECGGGGA
ncbi:MAG: permease [Hyphomicrobiaceae bacterium]